ncbi:hypothetical protein BaRGS_00007832, partial [Batillaria attramentaria]
YPQWLAGSKSGVSEDARRTAGRGVRSESVAESARWGRKSQRRNGEGGIVIKARIDSVALRLYGFIKELLPQGERVRGLPVTDWKRESAGLINFYFRGSPEHIVPTSCILSHDASFRSDSLCLDDQSEGVVFVTALRLSWACPSRLVSAARQPAGGQEVCVDFHPALPIILNSCQGG